MMKREHLSKHPLDDEISHRGLDLFLKSLDGMKLYFYQSDIDEFNQQRNDLDDMVNGGRRELCLHVFKRLLKRVDERVAMVNELLKGEFDFTADEVLVTDPDKLTYRRHAGRSQGAVAEAAQVRPARAQGRQGEQGRHQGAAAAAVSQLRQADAPDRQQRAAGDVPDVDHQRASIRTPPTWPRRRRRISRS